MRLCLDTNAYVALMRGQSSVVAAVRGASALLLPAVVVGELLYGFRHGSRPLENRRQLSELLAEPFTQFLAVTMTTCERFGMVAAALRSKGTSIPQNDIWIAAQALESGSDLLTFDQHFEQVDGLPLYPLAPPGPANR